jgi:hypothetical protein
MGDAKTIIILGVLVAVSIFVISIIFPIGGSNLAQSFTCGLDNITPDPTNCSWGQTYNPAARMSATEILIWSNVGTFAILVILLSYIGVAIRAIGKL